MWNILGVPPYLCAEKAHCSSCTNKERKKKDKYSIGPLHKQSEIRRLQLRLLYRRVFCKELKMTDMTAFILQHSGSGSSFFTFQHESSHSTAQTTAKKQNAVMKWKVFLNKVFHWKIPSYTVFPNAEFLLFFPFIPCISFSSCCTEAVEKSKWSRLMRQRRDFSSCTAAVSEQHTQLQQHSPGCQALAAVGHLGPVQETFFCKTS